MTKEIRLNAFDMNCVGHIQHGMWTHPRDRSVEYTTLEYWQDLARLAERGKFDGIFLADVVGVYDVYEGGPGSSIVNAAQIPVNDPMMVVPAMAAVTTQIGFGVTANLTYEPPYLFAGRLSTLDHLTRGRMGWNDGDVRTGAEPFVDEIDIHLGRPQCDTGTRGGTLLYQNLKGQVGGFAAAPPPRAQPRGLNARSAAKFEPGVGTR
jgi:Luciferase-like monooxygenase